MATTRAPFFSPRPRPVYLALAMSTVALGLGSRRFGSELPDFVAMYAGDALWASLMFWLICLVATAAPTQRILLGAIAIAFAVEVSQLYHTPMLDAIRGNRLGALVLGQGFLWSDLACYAVGAAAAAVIDATLNTRRVRAQA